MDALPYYKPRKSEGRGRGFRVLGYASYGEYLASDHWAAVRRRYRESKLAQSCYICGDSRYELHHRSYQTVGSENLKHLLPLCRKHHQAVHDIAVSDERATLWSASRILRRQHLGLTKRPKRQTFATTRSRRAPKGALKGRRPVLSAHVTC